MRLLLVRTLMARTLVSAMRALLSTELSRTLCKSILCDIFLRKEGSLMGIGELGSRVVTLPRAMVLVASPFTVAR